MSHTFSDFGAPALHRHPHDLRGTHLRRIGRDAAVLPPAGTDRVGDQVHGPEFFGGVGDEGCGAVEDGGAVVVIVGVGCEGED